MVLVRLQLLCAPCLGNTFTNLEKYNAVDEPDYMTSGQPCSNYSLSGNKKGEDGETGWMFVQQTKIIIKMQLKIFRLEISDNAINVNGGSEVNKVIAHLNTKYHVQWDILKVRSYGDPTNRARLFIVGTRRDITADTNLKDIRFEFPEPQFCGKNVPTIRMLTLKDEEVPAMYWRDDPTTRVKYWPHNDWSDKMRVVARSTSSTYHNG